MNRPAQPPLTDPFAIGDVEIANRVLLAPLAGIGNWFVRLQARRYGAGLAVSEMVSSSSGPIRTFCGKPPRWPPARVRT